MDPVHELRLTLLPVLQLWQQQLRASHPDVVVTLWDSPTGSATDCQGHDIGLDCLLKSASPDEPDNVALSVALKHLRTEPMIHSADVVWGHPSGHIEAELLPSPVAFSEANLRKVAERLPVLLSALQQALLRGRPSDIIS